MGQFDAGSIIGTLDVDRSPFTQGLELAKAQGDAFEKKKITANVDVNTGDTIGKLAALRAAADAAAGAEGGGGAGAAAAGGGLGFLAKAAIALGPALAPLATVTAGLGIGLAGIGASAGIGAAGLMLAAKPLFSTISSINQAQTAYNNAVAQYGFNSTQAKSAFLAMNEQLKQATPLERQAATALGSFTSYYKQWAQSFEPALLPLLTSGLGLAKVALGDLTPVVNGAATGMKGLFAGFNSFLSNKQTVALFNQLGTEISKVFGQLGTILPGIIDFLLKFIVAAAPFVNVVLGFLSQLVKYLDQIDFQKAFGPLLSSFEKLAPIVGRFLESLVALIASLLKAIGPIGVALFQTIAAAVTALLPVIKALNTVIGVLAPIVSSVAVAFAGVLGVALKGIAPLILDLLPLIQALVQLLAGGLIEIFNDVKPALTAIFPVLDALANAFVQFLVPIIPLLAQFISDIAPFTFIFNPIAQALNQLTPLFGALAKGIGAVLVPVANILGLFLSLGATVLEGLVPVIMQLAVTALGALVKVLQDLAPFMTVLETLFSSTVTTLIKEIAPVLGPLVTDVLQTLAKVLNVLLPYVPTLLGIFSATLVDSVTNLLPVLGPVVLEILTALATTLNQLAPLIPSLAQLFSQAVVDAVTTLAPALPAIAQAFAAILPPVTALALQVLPPLVSLLKSLPAPVLGIATAMIIFRGPLGQVVPLVGKLKDIFVGGWSFLTGIPGRIDKMGEALAGFVGKISDGLSAIGGFVSSVGDKLASMASATASFIADTAKSLASGIASFASWMAEHAVMAATYIGENLAMIASATAAFIAENAATLGIIAVIALLVGAIVYLATHWKQVWGDVKKIAGDVKDFLVKVFHDVVDFFEGPWGNAVLGAIAVFMPFIGIPLLVMKNWGVITGFFTDTFNAVASTISGWISDITSFFEAIPGTMESVGAHMWDWIKDGFKAVLNTIIGWWNDFVGLLKIPSFEIDTHIPGVGKIGFPGIDIGSSLKIPTLDTGGIVDGPTLAMLAKNSVPEAVTPLTDDNPFITNPKIMEAATQRLTDTFAQKFDELITEIRNLPTDTGEAVGSVVGKKFSEANEQATRQLVTMARKR